MLLSYEELILMNSISGGGSLPAVPPLADGFDKTSLIKKATKSLEEKNLLEQGRLSDSALALASSLENFRNAKRTMLLNALQISNVSTDFLVLLLPLKGQYELRKVLKTELLFKCFKDFPELFTGENALITSTPITMNLENWETTHADESEKGLTYQVKVEGKTQSAGILYKQADKVFHYDLVNKKLEQINPLLARRILLKTLSIHEETSNTVK